VNCVECNALCCQGHDSIFLFAPDIKIFQLLECEEGKDVRISQFGEMGYLETRGEPCPALDLPTNRCTIYQDRPMICRVFPYTLHYSKEGTCFDLSYCPQHLPDLSSCPQGNLDMLITWFKIPRPRFMAGMALRMLKDTWADWARSGLCARDRKRLDKHEAAYLARAHSLLVTRPVVPSDVLLFWGKLAVWSFDRFLREARLPLTSRNLCEWAQPRMQLVALQQYNEGLDFGEVS
jgi:Fe-S-cluster containining protein